MGFLDKMIKNAVNNGMSKGISEALGNAVKGVVEPKATELANKAAQEIEVATKDVTEKTNEATKATSELGGALDNLTRSLEGFATEASKNMKVCTECGETTSSDKTFCPNCGAKLPGKSLAEGAVCTKCGKQNTIGTKFCQDCGEKLPVAIEEEKLASDRDNNVLLSWTEKLSQYPIWNCGGYEFSIEVGEGYALFNAVFDNHDEAVVALEKYRDVLRANEFNEEGSYASPDNLYKNINGEWYNVDTSHLFEGDNNVLDIYFMKKEPYKD